MQQPDTKIDNPLAVASLVLGILSLTGASFLTAIPAIITGAMSLKNPVNKGMGIAGIIMGAVSIVLSILIILFFVLLIGASSLMAPEFIEEAPAPASDEYVPSAQQQA